MPRVELGTFWLRIKCSTNWATSARWIRPGEEKAAWAAWSNSSILASWCLFQLVIKRWTVDHELGLHFLWKKLQLPLSLHLLRYAPPVSIKVSRYISLRLSRKPRMYSNTDSFVYFLFGNAGPMLYQLSHTLFKHWWFYQTLYMRWWFYIYPRFAKYSVEWAPVKDAPS